MKRQNIEFKARLSDLHRIRQNAIACGAVPQGVLHQVDTYFNVNSGRLKLREFDSAAAELIHYHRDDSANPRPSDYSRLVVHSPQDWKAVLGEALGIRAVVCKSRELLLWKNVRIHLDTVESLGSFVELEAVVGPEAGADESRRNLEELMSLLGIGTGDIVAAGYVDLLEQTAAPS